MGLTVMIWRTLGMASSETVLSFGWVIAYTLFPAGVLFTSYLQAFKHIFTSPSSIEKEVKATRSGNARIHGILRATAAALAGDPKFKHITNQLINNTHLAGDPKRKGCGSLLG